MFKKDGDQLFTTNNPIILKNTHELPAIQCIQRRANKEIITEELLIEANKNSFGDEIGTTTNYITAMTDIQNNFDEDSDEYKELSYRIKCGQHYQQVSIDKTKGIIANPMPKFWYDRNAVKNLDESERGFNYRICADKKPYFMCYIYPRLMTKYKKYITNSNKKAITKFGCSIEELKNKSNTAEEEKFLYYYDLLMLVSLAKSTINRICFYVESVFGDIKANNTAPFDYKILKRGVTYKKSHYNAVQSHYKEYMALLANYTQIRKNQRVKDDDFVSNLKKSFRQKCLECCSSSIELCDIVIDICYKRNTSKQFAWDICGEEIIENLLEKHNRKINYVEKDPNGYIYYCGNRFSVKTTTEEAVE